MLESGCLNLMLLYRSSRGFLLSSEFIGNNRFSGGERKEEDESGEDEGERIREGGDETVRGREDDCFKKKCLGFEISSC